jgi:predicted phosphoribosyltransferase
MAAVYYKNRSEAGQKAAQSLLSKSSGKSSVVSLNTDSVLVAAQIAVSFKCPLHLYLSNEVTVPGNLDIASVDQFGNMNYRSDLGSGFKDYYYQEFRSYIDEESRESFSELNRELGDKEVLRKDLIENRNVFLTIDCLESVSAINSFLSSIKLLSINKLIICAPIALSNTMSDIQRLSNEYFTDGIIDFFFGADHYFEDNTVLPREEAIEKISKLLQLWP